MLSARRRPTYRRPHKQGQIETLSAKQNDFLRGGSAVPNESIEYRIVFANWINLDTADILRSRIVGALNQQNFGTLTILFSSEGGSTDQSMALYNFIRQLPVPVHMHAMGHVGSAAFPVFLAADKRTSAKNARFFLHEYDWGFSGNQTLHRIQEATDRLKSDIELAKSIIQLRTKIPAAMLGAIGGEAPPAIITPDDAKKLRDRGRYLRSWPGRENYRLALRHHPLASFLYIISALLVR
jgi:ATP-dependent protease ClpP protease subunit